AMVSFLAMDAHRHLQRSPLHPPSFGIYLVFSVLNKEDETTKLRDSFLAACAATLGGAACGSWWFTCCSCAFLIFAWCQGCEDCPDSGEGAHGFAAWPDLYGLGSSGEGSHGEAMCLLQRKWISELLSQFLDFLYDFLDKNYSSSSTRGVSPLEAPVVNRCGIEAVILVLGTIFSFVETIIVAAFVRGWRLEAAL
ncbi:hypothetical protein HID58_034193, partial [Brassica napus]